MFSGHPQNSDPPTFLLCEATGEQMLRKPPEGHAGGLHHGLRFSSRLWHKPPAVDSEAPLT